MAAKRRLRRTTRPVKKRRSEKARIQRRCQHARRPQIRRHRLQHGRNRAGSVCARGPHAAHRHSGDQQSARDLRSRRARTALGRHHQGGRGTSGEPCDAVRRCGAQRRSRARGAAGLLRPAHARPQCRRFADRPRGGQGPAVVGRYFRKAAGIRDRRSRPPARGGGEPDRQCREIHRTGQCHPPGHAPAQPERQGRRCIRGLRQRDRPHARRDQTPVPAVFAGQCLDCIALRRRRARIVVGQATGARHGRRCHRDATPWRRHHLYLQCRDVIGKGRAERRRPAPMARHRSVRRGRCACSASRTIRSAASSSTRS